MWYTSMQMMHRNAVKTDRPPSVITTITQGYQSLNRHLWILVLPLLVDLFLWQGPRISPQPLFGRLIGDVAVPELRAQIQTLLDQDRTGNTPLDLRVDGTRLNLLGTLSGTITTPRPPLAQPTWHVGSMAALGGTLLLSNAIGLLLSSIYLLLLGDAILSRPTSGNYLNRGIVTFGRMVGVVLLWIVIAIGALLPFIIVAALSMLLSPVLSYAVVLVGAIMLLWIWFTTQWAFDAVVVSGAGVRTALLGSVWVVRRFFMDAVTLVLVSMLIAVGLSVIWQALARAGILGLLIAMAGSAYISTGLAAAHLIFFRDRVKPARPQPAGQPL
ncbi:MAG: hypothetical protein NVS4B8_07200 [Herpetosiphon sp.]